MARILLVEDYELNRDMLSRRLRRKGFQVSEAGDGLECLAQVAKQIPDIILMDMSLPEMNGWEATQRIKNDPATARVPIIGLSAHAIDGDRQKAISAGCDDYLTKPIDFQILVQKIEAFLPSSKT